MTLLIDELLSLQALRSATILSRGAGARRRVLGVQMLESTTATDIEAHALVIVACPMVTAARSAEVDLLLRRIADRKGVGLVLRAEAAPVPQASVVLAEKLGLLLIVLDAEAQLLPVAVEVTLAVRRPEVEQAARLLEVARDAAPADDLGQFARVLTRRLGARVLVCTLGGVILAGSAEPNEVRELLAMRRSGTHSRDGQESAVLVLEALPAGVPTLWVQLTRTDAGAMWRETAGRALELLRGQLVAWLALQILDVEREAGRASGLLLDLLAAGEHIPHRLTEQARIAGWNLSPWVTGIHVFSARSHEVSAFSAHTLLDGLVEPLRLNGRFIRLGGGWVSWQVSHTEPTAAEVHELAADLESRVRATIGEDRWPIAIGVGAPRLGPEGLGQTLAEASDAARSEKLVEGVHAYVVRGLSASRVLTGWLTSTQAVQAAQFLEPLAAEEVLIETLRVWLAHSGQQHGAANELGVHRNTVRQRLRRVEEMLGADLHDPDTRLALQLALRAI